MTKRRKLTVQQAKEFARIHSAIILMNVSGFESEPSELGPSSELSESEIEMMYSEIRTLAESLISDRREASLASTKAILEHIKLSKTSANIVVIKKQELLDLISGSFQFQLAQLYSADRMSIPCKDCDTVTNDIVAEFTKRYMNI